MGNNSKLQPHNTQLYNVSKIIKKVRDSICIYLDQLTFQLRYEDIIIVLKNKNLYQFQLVINCQWAKVVKKLQNSGKI